jgi:hypothetical protein
MFYSGWEEGNCVEERETGESMPLFLDSAYYLPALSKVTKARLELGALSAPCYTRIGTRKQDPKP